MTLGTPFCGWSRPAASPQGERWLSLPPPSEVNITGNPGMQGTVCASPSADVCLFSMIAVEVQEADGSVSTRRPTSGKGSRGAWVCGSETAMGSDQRSNWTVKPSMSSLPSQTLQEHLQGAVLSVTLRNIANEILKNKADNQPFR